MRAKVKLTYFLIAASCWVIVWTSFSFGLFRGLESFIEDLLLSPRPFEEDIVILAIDSQSINSIGQWPWPRRVFAEALMKLDKNPPRAVGFDVILSEPSRRGREDDLTLAEALDGIRYPLILPVEASDLEIKKNDIARAGRLLKPLSIFTESKSANLGHVNLILDNDGVVRRFPAAILSPEAEKRETIKSFANNIFLSARTGIPTKESGDGVLRIVFVQPVGGVRRIPFARFTDQSFTEDLSKKIVLIGATSPDLHDEKPTPLGRGTAMPGVEIQANIINMLSSGLGLKPLGAAASSLWLFAATLLPAVIFLIFSRSLKPLAINVFLGAGYMVAIISIFERGLAANVIHINAAWILSTFSLFSYRYFSGEKERREMRNLFSKYVSQEVLEEILREPAKVKLGGEEKEITVFFSDIRGFTTLSEKTTPQELVQILNRYFTAMSGAILEKGGVLDKYIGDAIMAFWGAPIDNPLQADRALEAALGMIKKLKELNIELAREFGAELDIGIGLYTGLAVVGNIGSESRFDYTVIGDTVNVASRLEGLNKEYKTKIIIGETTKNRIASNYKFRTLGQVAVKGRKEALNIFTIEE